MKDILKKQEEEKDRTEKIFIFIFIAVIALFAFLVYKKESENALLVLFLSLSSLFYGYSVKEKNLRDKFKKQIADSLEYKETNRKFIPFWIKKEFRHAWDVKGSYTYKKSIYVTIIETKDIDFLVFENYKTPFVKEIAEKSHMIIQKTFTEKGSSYYVVQLKEKFPRMYLFKKGTISENSHFLLEEIYDFTKELF